MICRILITFSKYSEAVCEVEELDKKTSSNVIKSIKATRTELQNKPKGNSKPWAKYCGRKRCKKVI